jgi:CheY-like chemotaxis protein
MTTLARSYFPGPAVIVASSNPEIRKQIVQCLRQSRITAAEAQGDADGLGKLESTDCQLLFLNHKVPDLDVEELLQIIHRRFPCIDVLLFDEVAYSLCLRSDAARRFRRSVCEEFDEEEA